jgi:FMN-dependent oxidoreductase (nitrilotriacetate monooxygenase family)
MSSKTRRLAISAFFMRFGHHPAAWRHRSQVATGRPDVGYWIRMAQLSEEAKLDAFFLADFIGRSAERLDDTSRMGGAFQFEPVTLLSAIAAVTKHIGLVTTVNTNYTHPYNVARALASLDHISGGRAGWNVVSSFMEAPGKNFGIPTPSHADRYRRADEFVDVAKRLWDSWEDSAFDHPDRREGLFFDPADAHPLRHAGEHFNVEGLLDVARPIQGYPVFVQAGNSDTGRDFAAKVAEMTYASAQSLAVAKEYYADVKGRMAKYGREPDDLKITPGLSVVVAPTSEEARGRFDELQEAVDFSHGVNLMGLDLSGYPLDGPLPENLAETENGKGRVKQLVELARRENLTIRELVLRFNVSKGHVQVVGSPKHVADFIEEWFVSDAADGFNLVPPLLPGGFEDFVRLVIPELQRRGLFRKEYEGATFRENVGLKRPANPLARRPESGDRGPVAARPAPAQRQPATA